MDTLVHLRVYKIIEHGPIPRKALLWGLKGFDMCQLVKDLIHDHLEMSKSTSPTLSKSYALNNVILFGREHWLPCIVDMGNKPSCCHNIITWYMEVCLTCAPISM